MKFRFIAIVIILIISLAGIIFFIKANNSNDNHMQKGSSLKSEIKVITSTVGDWISSGETYYYIVTESGNKKCDKFEGNADVYYINYDNTIQKRADDTYIDKSLDSKLYNYVSNISELIENEKLYRSEIEMLFVYNNRYFVTVLDNSPKMNFYDILYEYDIKNNKLNEITRFKGEGIDQIYVIK